MDLGAARQRVVIEDVQPEVDCGRYPVKRTVGERLTVTADVFADGTDELSCVLLYRREEDPSWSETPMMPLGNDRWEASFTVEGLGRYRYAVAGWVDRFKTWRSGLQKKVVANVAVEVELLEGANLVSEAAQRASQPSPNRGLVSSHAGGNGHARGNGHPISQESPRRERVGVRVPLPDAARLEHAAEVLRGRSPHADRVRAALDPDLALLMARYPDRRFATRSSVELAVTVDRERARFSTWYEMFPRSAGADPEAHGTFRDCEELLPYIAGMGFDVLYLPPVHPIGRAFRKGPNNTLSPRPQDPGSPWAIGAWEGGHKAVHPELGTLRDFRRLVATAAEHGIDVALDLAFQLSPDHPYVRQHPAWFRHRSDGTIQYAENPPKKYLDIYPFDFECEDWEALWQELKDIVLFWVEQGVRIFRVDNPHTKAFPFWEWLIDEVKRQYPEVMFLAEAFTRPKVMYRLAKLGFTQSYTYFAWRNAKWELEQYFTELTQTPVREFFRPNLWPNTPDILTEYLQTGGRPAFMVRLVLAATLGASYGIYGPAFELMDPRPRDTGAEEYLDSEKYQIRQWDRHRPDSLRWLVSRVNRIRRENSALQWDRTLHFHPTDNEQLICYSKQTEDRSNQVIVAANLDPHHIQAGWVKLDLEDLGLSAEEPFQVHDLLTDTGYTWQGSRNYLELRPQEIPAHILLVSA